MREAPEEEGRGPDLPGQRLLGVVLAGGEGRRFGRAKPLAPLAGRPMAAWALDALRPHFPLTVTLANDPEVPLALGVPGRPDRIGGLGPLGGLLSALEWAGEEGLAGAFLLACDLPLVGMELVGGILDRWPPAAQAVVPESPGPRGFEPLCAGYRLGCLPAVQEMAAAGPGSMADVLGRVGGRRIPMGELGGRKVLQQAFLNVNTPDDARRAEDLVLGRLP